MREVRERARNRCEYCRTPADFAPEPFEMEHITPRTEGGATVAANLALACGGCNGHKGARTSATDPESHEIVALFHPRRDQWNLHFTWSDDLQMVIGRTDVGHATIETLQLNRLALRNLRWLLATQNLHPSDKD